jgi:hypothetical protein
LATKLSAIYPDFAEKLGALLPQIAANDHELNVINRPENRPAGAPVLQCAELKARNLASFRLGPSEVPRLVDVLVLPRWRPHDGRFYFWPPR